MTGTSRVVPDAALERAARRWGVEASYLAADGTPVRSSDAAVRAALGALGAPLDDPDGGVRAHSADRWARPVEPVAVCWEGDPPEVPVRLLARERDGGVRCALRREDGGTREWTVPAADLPAARLVPEDGVERVHARLALPADLPRGYHELTVRAGDRTGTTRIVRAPRRAWTPEHAGEAPPRAWGLFAPLYALRSARTPGVADLTDLRALQRWTAARGGTHVATLPLLPTFLDRPFDPSPYAPVSRLFWNELYLDCARVPGFDTAPRTQALLASPAYRAESERLRRTSAVDYRAGIAHRRRALATLAEEIAPRDAPLPPALQAYVGARPEALDYAAFRASAQGDPVDEALVRQHLVAQWALEGQIVGQARGAAPGDPPAAALYMDLPLGSHAEGFDVRRRPDLFGGASAGAPPDPFFSGGQDWGFPPLHPERARRDGHAYWIASLRHVMRAASLLRLDHVMGLHRLYWIPRGMPATDGVYVRYPADELYAILCLESHRHRTELVGEDLGTVPAEVRDGLRDRGLRRMFVVPFELEADPPRLPAPPRDAVASVGTHDLPPFRGFLEGRDLEDRPAEERAARQAGRRALADALGAAADAPAALLAAALLRLAESEARLVLIALEDLWLETEPQNRPGTAGTHNWTRPARHGLDALDGLDGTRDLLERIGRARRDAPVFRHAAASTQEGTA